MHDSPCAVVYLDGRGRLQCFASIPSAKRLFSECDPPMAHTKKKRDVRSNRMQPLEAGGNAILTVLATSGLDDCIINWFHSRDGSCPSSLPSTSLPKRNDTFMEVTKEVGFVLCWQSRCSCVLLKVLWFHIRSWELGGARDAMLRCGCR